jgi:hypothetical protein
VQPDDRWKRTVVQNRRTVLDDDGSERQLDTQQWTHEEIAAARLAGLQDAYDRAARRNRILVALLRKALGILDDQWRNLSDADRAVVSRIRRGTSAGESDG